MSETNGGNPAAPIRIGTRGSDLALWQARYLRDGLARAGHAAELVIIETHGDRVQDRSFTQMSGTGFFTAELEQALLDGRVDVAVHSHKDLPTEQPDGLMVAAVSSRAEASDVLLSRPDRRDATRVHGLGEGAVVGTSSQRRRVQLLAERPDLDVRDLRGNVPTRIGKLRDGQYDAILVAGAALERLELDLEGLTAERLDPADFVPAPAQGVLAYEIRRGEPALVEALQAVHDGDSVLALRAERKLLANLRGGCQLPFGAWCREEDGIFRFHVLLGETDGRPPRRLFLEHFDPEVLVVEAWNKLHAAPPSRVFLSREAEAEGLLARTLAAHGVALHAESLLDITALEPDWPAGLDALFFSSRTAVRHYAALGDRAPRLPVAAIGRGTARDLRRLGLEPTHVLDPTDLAGSAADWRAAHAGQRVGFPQAAEGLRSVQGVAGDALTCVDIPLYRSAPRSGFTVERPALAILTSPLNARAYLERYPDRKGDRFAAIGNTTAWALRRLGAHDVYTARRPHELALVEAVFSA